jgi:RluA family pseudouridine synthase
MAPIVLQRTPTDVFPNIDIPVAAVCWNYAGMSPQQMEDRVVAPYERFMTTVVDNIEHTESQTVAGRSVIKVFFHPGTDVHVAITQITAISQTMIRQLPPGISPPLIITYSASSVPILQLGMNGKGLSEQELFDFGANIVRNQLATVAGAAIPWPYGGKQRQVSVNLDIPALQAKGLSPTDVINAVSAQNLVIPSGTVKIGPTEFNVDINGSPDTIAELNNIPIKTASGATIYVKDVAYVSDGFSPQINIARMNGQRGVLLAVYKTGDTSTLDVVKQVYAKLPMIKSILPPQLVITPMFDQSIFVRAAIQGVIREGLVAACLTALMILLFLGSWRSTLIIAISIPLSILVSIIVLSALHETINLMTLGGLALAVGILVDDATVEIENINRNIAQGKQIVQAILDGAQQIAVPAFVSTLSICIVFVPMFFLTGVAKFLFVPMAEAVVFAMLASYVLSRTLVPTLAKYLLKNQHGEEHATGDDIFSRIQRRFARGFDRMRTGYRASLTMCIDHAGPFVILFLSLCIGSMFLLPVLGRDFFPSADAGLIRLHMRARAGQRVRVELPPPAPTGLVPEAIPLDVVYEDADLLVVNKPAGLTVHPAPGHPSGTLANALVARVGHLPGSQDALRPGIVHRLDKDTSGLLVVAKTEDAHRSLAAQLRARTVTRTYLALVRGRIERDEGTVRAPVGRHPSHRTRQAVTARGRPAATHYAVLERFADATLVACRLETGRTHQIRVHMAHIGHPILGDPVYGRAPASGLHRQALHAARLEFTHPATGLRLVCSAPLPDDIVGILTRLRAGQARGRASAHRGTGGRGEK